MPVMPVLVDVDPASVESLPCCGVKNPVHDGRVRKNCWLKSYFPKGLKAKVLVLPGNRQCGYIEYVPGEYAWRGVNAPGYMFIHCIWTFSREIQHKGFGRTLIQACIDDALKSGMKGLAVVARNRPWLAKPDIFLANSFEVVDSAPPDYQLLVRKFDGSAENPAFTGEWEKKLKKYGKGLTIIRSDQCPHIAKFAGEIIECAKKEYGVDPRIVELKSHKDAQRAPTPYAVFSIIHDGRVIADHQISRTRFRNIMNRLMTPAAR
jgi:hypothetical protein